MIFWNFQYDFFLLYIWWFCVELFVSFTKLHCFNERFFLSKSSRHVQVNGLQWNTMSGKMPVSYMAWKHIEDRQIEHEIVT